MQQDLIDQERNQSGAMRGHRGGHMGSNYKSDQGLRGRGEKSQYLLNRLNITTGQADAPPKDRINVT